MIHFDEFRLDTAALRVFRGAVRLEASPQTVEVLAYLIAYRDCIVSRQELLDRFWPRAGTGGDAALNTCIRRIRTLLDDDAETPRYIQTRPRSGYRFIGALAEVTADPPRRRLGWLAITGGALATLVAGGAVWAQIGMPAPQQRIAIEPVRGLCEYVLFPKFNAGLRESFLAQASRRLPEGYGLIADGSRADLHVRVGVRQTPARTVVTLTLVQEGNGGILWTGEFAARTDSNDYVPLQRELAERMAIALAHALDQRA
ncbi:winged helix-turn-helix domain-containing protein [Sphingomonas sp. DT-204]|uniref:winged helix-turn-helix domain-containing protein n=1 Tax=Sphingomonas sp. DT-204 TaxID=3396166 RepID=UPI003F19EE28